MSSVQTIKPIEYQELKELHESFEKKVKHAGYSAAAASFLLIGALIVITCASLCLMLPGVNTITDIVLPAIVPGVLTIVVSIPLILLTIKHNQDKNFFRGRMIDRMISHLENNEIALLPKQERVNFILKNFLDWQEQEPGELQKNTVWTSEYQKQILDDLKKKIGENKKNRNPVQEKIAKTLDKAQEKVSQKKPN